MCKSWYSIGICIGIKNGKSNPDPNRHKHDAGPQNWWILFFKAKNLKETKNRAWTRIRSFVYWWFDLVHLSDLFTWFLLCRTPWSGQPLRPCSGSWRISSPCPTQSTRTPPPTSVFVLRLLRPCPPPTSVLVLRLLASLSSAY